MFNARRLRMKQFAFSAFFVGAALAGNLHNATGQMINPTVQTASPRVATTRSVAVAKPVARPAIAPQVAPAPAGLNPQRFNSTLPRMIAQPAFNPQRTYPLPVNNSNPAFAALNVQRSGRGQPAITVDPATRQTELRTLAAMRQRRGVVTREGNILEPATRENEIRTLAMMRERRGFVTGQTNTLDSAIRETESRTLQKMHEHHGFGTNNRTLATIDPQRHITNRDPEAGPQRDGHESPKD